MWSQQGLDSENKSVMGAQLNQVSGPLKEIKLSPERGHLMRGRLADSDEWRVTLGRVWGRHNICIWTGDDFSSMNPPPFCFFLSLTLPQTHTHIHTHTHTLPHLPPPSHFQGFIGDTFAPCVILAIYLHIYSRKWWQLIKRGIFFPCVSTAWCILMVAIMWFW